MKNLQIYSVFVEHNGADVNCVYCNMLIAYIIHISANVISA